MAQALRRARVCAMTTVPDSQFPVCNEESGWYAGEALYRLTSYAVFVRFPHSYEEQTECKDDGSSSSISVDDCASFSQHSSKEGRL
jgi:hypothetical protein